MLSPQAIIGVVALYCSMLVTTSGLAATDDLVKAAFANDVSQVKAILAAGDDVNVKTPSGTFAGATALIAAAISGNLEIVNLLLAAKADVNATDNDGATALHYAVTRDHKTIVKVLQQYGGKDVAGHPGPSPGTYASSPPIGRSSNGMPICSGEQLAGLRPGGSLPGQITNGGFILWSNGKPSCFLPMK
jgi:Ankyrin repeats (3 copies)